MPIPGYTDYQRREYCKDVRCPVQLQLQTLAPESPEYEQTRLICQTVCKHTTWEFHHWLIRQGYLIVRPIG